jgi:hypothetical protein
VGSRRLGSAEFRSILWLLPVSLTIHNVEEWIWLPGWSTEVGLFESPVSPAAFRFALVVVTAAGWLVAILAAGAEKGSLRVYALVGAAAVLLLNVIFPHLLATVVLGTYAPGVASAVLVNSWASVLILRAAVRDGYATRKGVVVATAWTALILVPGVAASFWVGGILEASCT